MNPNTELPNRGKRSVGLDISTDEGREILYRLLDSADVFCTNFLPGTRQRLAIDVEHIRARNPRVVYALGTGQGSLGPEAERGGFDLACAWARAGAAFQMTPTVASLRTSRGPSEIFPEDSPLREPSPPPCTGVNVTGTRRSWRCRSTRSGSGGWRRR